MKKMLKNKKGFTLIELLAVIVVLAIIMVIATQQVNGTIKKSRGNSFYETAQSIRKGMQTVCATDNKISTSTLRDAVEAKDVEINVYGTAGITGEVKVTAKTGGKFINRTDPTDISDVFKLSGNTYSFSTECPLVETNNDPSTSESTSTTTKTS